MKKSIQPGKSGEWKLVQRIWYLEADAEKKTELI